MIISRLKNHVCTRINRNIVECKLRCRKPMRRRKPELIETLWNVNIYNPDSVQIHISELIETLWNVNIPHHNKNLIAF